MNDSVSILVAVFLILIALRWMLGGNQANQQQQQGARRTTVRRMQHRVTPQMIEMVRAMFPDIPTAAIQADLARTGSVETTVDNALRDGGLPLPPPVAIATNNSQQGSPNNSPNATTSHKSPSHANLVQRYKIDVNQQDQQTEEEPPKVWEASPDKRQEMLRKRKEFMVLQARKKLMEQQQKKEQEEEEQKLKEINAAESSSSGKKEESNTTTFDEMSVDELNSLSAEQRRNQMLEALQKRISS